MPRKSKMVPPQFVENGKLTGISLIQDVDGPVDDAWHEAMKKYVVPELLGGATKEANAEAALREAIRKTLIDPSDEKLIDRMVQHAHIFF